MLNNQLQSCVVCLFAIINLDLFTFSKKKEKTSKEMFLYQSLPTMLCFLCHIRILVALHSLEQHCSSIETSYSKNKQEEERRKKEERTKHSMFTKKWDKRVVEKLPIFWFKILDGYRDHVQSVQTKKTNSFLFSLLSCFLFNHLRTIDWALTIWSWFRT